MHKLLTILSSLGLISSGASTALATLPTIKTSASTFENFDHEKQNIVDLSEISKENGNKFEVNTTTQEKKSFILNSSVGKQDFEELYFKGSTYEQTKRLYIDSSSDQTLPDLGSPKPIDLKYPKAKRDTDYYNQVDLVDINYLDYATDKTNFLKLFNTFKFQFDFGFNLWNSAKGWSTPNGKSLTYNPYSELINITGNDKFQTILQATDPNHSNNESVTFQVKEEWEGSHFRIKVRAVARIHWASGSIYHHASMAGFKNENVILFRNPGGVETVKRHLDMPSTFSGAFSSGTSLKMGTQSLSVLKGTIKADMNLDNWIAAMIVTLNANFDGTITASNGYGTSIIRLNSSGLAKLIDAMNLDLNTDIPYIFNLELNFQSIGGGMMVSKIYLTLNYVTYNLATSNSFQILNNMKGTWIGAYSANYLGAKVVA